MSLSVPSFSLAKMCSFFSQQGRENFNLWVPERQITTKSQINLNIELKRGKTVTQIEVLAKVNINQLCVGESSIVPVTSVKNLGSWFDKNMSMTTHIIKVCKAASFHLYNIRRIRKYLTKTAWRKCHDLLITLAIKCQPRTTLWRKRRLQKFPQGCVMTNFARAPKSAIF